MDRRAGRRGRFVALRLAPVRLASPTYRLDRSPIVNPESCRLGWRPRPVNDVVGPCALRPRHRAHPAAAMPGEQPTSEGDRDSGPAGEAAQVGVRTASDDERSRPRVAASPNILGISLLRPVRSWRRSGTLIVQARGDIPGLLDLAARCLAETNFQLVEASLGERTGGAHVDSWPLSGDLASGPTGPIARFARS